jgi:phosphoenolpyruvate phosphomutase
MIIARIESYIAGKSTADALRRARAYIRAGADGLMIHSQAKTAKEILSFCREYKKFKTRVPLMVVPSTYNKTVEASLQKAGASIVVYANQLLRSAYPAMRQAAETILKHGRSYEAEAAAMPIREIVTLIPPSV